MSSWLTHTLLSVLTVLVGTAAFFFMTTRGTLLVRGLLPGERKPADHVYPIYSNMHLIRLVDFQPIIAAILLFQYDRLVSTIVDGLRSTDLRGKRTLITSCAFGNVMPRVALAARDAGANEVQVVDIIENELLHARRKMQDMAQRLSFHRQDATALALPDASVHANVLFFLLHELPHPLKSQALKEACRVLAPGGKLYLAEFHRPRLRSLRALSWTYFKVFEPLGLALWSSHEPLAQLSAMPGITCERHTVFFGNFQVIVATKAVELTTQS
ncbi:methyltransferase domain-containing protein [Piscinibacter sp.]|uniref:methyltransferase domain-containing protein n=1 Tax=Piscinibacter sp. TaxID=1903157 RepID=UPI002C567370|nr:methyltransferase domain-containing protein [Albitalea sp.]HUG23422.1 methyltransferase domain-containing protein [Albitalea sp.]